MAERVKLTEIVCPFCCEGDFDLIGLKHHFQAGHCDEYETTPLRNSDEDKAGWDAGRSALASQENDRGQS